MTQGRRAFFQLMGMGAAGAFLVDMLTAQRQPPQKVPQEPELPTPDPKNLLKANQKQIKRDVEKLYELAGELKKEVEKTDSAEVLSLGMVRKAEEIEKLAKRIKSLARG